MSATHLTAAISLVLLLCGCVQTRAIPYEMSAREAKQLDYPVQILDPANVTKPYKVIGVVEAYAGKLYDPKATLETLRKEARKLGGDALVDLQRGGASFGAVTAGAVTGGGTVRERWSAKVIVWE